MMDTGEGEDMAGRDDRDVPPVSENRRRGPVARLALTRRVVAALDPLEGADIDADVENPALPQAATSTPLLRTDLLIRALDLRMRLALLPGANSTELATDDVLAAGLSMLISNPETASVVVVADDAELTCRIIEPFDRRDAVVSAEASETDAVSPRSGPVATVLRAYLRQINPGWEPPPRIGQVSTDIDAVALLVAQDSLAKLQSQRKNTPEWREARLALDDDDAAWVRDLALSIVLKERDPAAVIAALDKRAGRRT